MGKGKENISDIFQTNEVTPRQQAYHPFVQSELPGISDVEQWWKAIASIKLYHIKGFLNPVRYVSVGPVRTVYAPLSSSGFYGKEDHVKNMVSGYECGGSGGRLRAALSGKGGWRKACLVRKEPMGMQ